MIILVMLYNLLFVPSTVCRKSLVNRNNFRLFYEPTVKNALKIKEMPLNHQKMRKKKLLKNNQYRPKHILYLRTNVSKHQKKKDAFASKSQA